METTVPTTATTVEIMAGDSSWAGAITMGTTAGIISREAASDTAALMVAADSTAAEASTEVVEGMVAAAGAIGSIMAWENPR
jgi:hypothetical protein